MYNGQVLRKLIAEAGLTKKQFEEQVFRENQLACIM